MRNRGIFGVLALVVSAGTLSAQTPSPMSNSVPMDSPAALAAVDGNLPTKSAFLESHGPDCDTPSCFWVSTEYLLWWVKNGPLPVPLVTGNSDPGTIAALTDSGTHVLFGAGANSSLDYRTFSGLRVTAGGWLGDDATLGLEGSGFLLERRSVLFNAASVGGTAPVVSIPFNATQPFLFNPAGETSFNAGNVPNSVTASSSTRLWGAEANLLLNATRGDRFSLGLLAGFRYLDLAESLNLSDQFADALTGGTLSVADGFGTRNQFYGGQLGVKAGMTLDRLTVDGVAKVALGDSHEVLSINGTTIVTQGAFGFPTGVTRQGIFAEPSNFGRYRRDVFAAVPEVDLRVGYAVTDHVRGFVGYDFLYVSDVLRPGNQIDRNINPTQNPQFGGGVVTGAPLPVGATHRSDFWAQGVTFGLEVRY